MTSIGQNELAVIEAAEEAAGIREMAPPTVESYRSIIDGCDDVILDAILARAQAVQALGELKLQEGRPVRDISRENEVLRRQRERAMERGGEPSIVGEVWNVLFQHARVSQEQRRQIGRPAVLGGIED